MQVLNINQKHTVNDYPYGRLKCTAFFSVEFKKNKGFRHVFQTINPKTGRLNAAKNSTYNSFAFNWLQEETGHIMTRGINFYDWKSYNSIFNAIVEHPELELTTEMIQELCGNALAHIRASLGYYRDEKFEQLKTKLEKPIKILVEGFKTGDVNLLKEFKININE